MDPPAVPPLPPMPPENTLPPVVNNPETSANEVVPVQQDGHDHSESESDEEPPPQYQWQPLEEDKTEPCEDEMAYIAGRDEHSATDRLYWEKKTFFDLNDPELPAGESGRIDWLVEHFNGTKENPNTEVIMRSEIVKIGGYDWRIKFYPRGNDTDYLSLYLECVTMQPDDFEATELFPDTALPFLEGTERLERRKAVSAQVSVVMYNPAEPRVYEYHRDAHKFTKNDADYGWTRFTSRPRYDFHVRDHGQRTSILRDDKLAFSAYIRIMEDPTNCLWAHGNNPYEDSLMLTGLRPFTPLEPFFAAELPLLHFAPFRKFISECKGSKIVFWMQTLLYKMMTRKHSRSYGAPFGGPDCVQSDTTSWLRFLARALRKETSPATITELIGTLDPEKGAALSYNRLKTKNCGSVQKAVDAHPFALEKPALLAMELERQEFDREKRKWEKLTNKVEMETQINVSGALYLLYAFTTHCGDLTSNKFNVYIRPNGPTRPWYKYSNGNVTCLTNKQAAGKHSGYDEPPTPVKAKRHPHHFHRHDVGMRNMYMYRNEDPDEVAQAVYYVRDDYKHHILCHPPVEKWYIPKNVADGIPPTFDGVVDDQPPATAVYERFTEAAEAAADAAAAAVLTESQQALAESQQAPPDIDSRRESFEIDAGYATPNCWQMDGEDVVMSDIDAEESALEDSAPEKQTTELQIDVLGREYFKGHVLDGEYHGPGHIIFQNGDEYIGSFAHSQKSGHGRMIYAASGNVYDGEWKDDEQHGFGKLVEASSGNVFEGGWKEGKKHGDFVLRGTMTDDDKGCCGICYDREINTAFYDCGHVMACKECAGKIEVCPICRKRVMARLELFGVRMTFE